MLIVAEAPQIETTDALSLRLQAEGEGQEADTQILVTDKEMDINRKFKKAFCEPGNLDFNPPVQWVEALLSTFNMNEFVDRSPVKRKEQNGGDLEYTSVAKLKEASAFPSEHVKMNYSLAYLRSASQCAMGVLALGQSRDFGGESLHPGDLKPSLAKAMNAVRKRSESRDARAETRSDGPWRGEKRRVVHHELIMNS
eukprot:Skav229964  [mRNA]  locus=scaffold327:197678:204314:+ [translate_table: standard]